MPPLRLKTMQCCANGPLTVLLKFTRQASYSGSSSFSSLESVLYASFHSPVCSNLVFIISILLFIYTKNMPLLKKVLSKSSVQLSFPLSFLIIRASLHSNSIALCAEDPVSVCVNPCACVFLLVCWCVCVCGHHSTRCPICTSASSE